MIWTQAEKIEALNRAPMGRDLLREDTQVIERPGWYQIITPSTKSWVLNEVMRSQLEESEVESTIDQVIAQYRGHGLPVKWFVGPWTTPSDFGSRLEKRGFGSWDVRAMACDTAMELDVGGVVMEPVTSSNVDRYVDAFCTGWEIAADQADEHRRTFVRAMAANPRTAYLFLATIDGQAAATTGLLLRDRYAYLVGAQVLDRFRGRGLYRALIDARLRFLRDRGVTLAVTFARESSSAPMLAHLGFESLFDCRCYYLE